MRRGSGPWIAAAVAFVVGATIWWIVSERRHGDPNISGVVKIVQGFRAEIQQAVDEHPNDVTQLEAALHRIETEQDKWLNFSTEADIRALQTRIRTRLDELHRK
jgi:hypothetical protein